MESSRKARRQPRSGGEAAASPTPEPGVESTASPAWAGTPYLAPAVLVPNAKEAAADALAAEALRHRPVVGADRGLQATRAPAELEAGAVPLPDGVRRDFEARFGYDLSEVLVRTSDPEVAERGSLAMAMGRVIAFAPGAWDPRSVKGRELIAHELAHVVMAQGQPAVMASQKAPAAVSFYQDVIDAFNASWGFEMMAIKPLLTLCQSVEAEVAAEVSTGIDALEKAHSDPKLPHWRSSSATAAELMARIALLGLGGQAARLRNWHLKGRPAPAGRRYYDDEEWYWRQVVGLLRDKVAWGNTHASLKVLDALDIVIPELKKERDGLDPQLVKEDQERLKADTTQPGFGMQSGPHVTIALYHLHLGVLMRTAFVNAQAPIQAVMDLATTELATGRGSATLDELAKRLVTMGSLVMPDLDIEVNESAYEKKGGKDVLMQVDAFPDQPGAKARKVPLNAYDVEAERMMLYPRPSQMVSPARMLVIRNAQVVALRKIYGLEKVGGKQTAEAAENEAASKGLGKDGLRLHNDDDWQKLLLAKYRAHAASSSPAAGFESLVDLLKVYLRAFTTHSPMNIDDFGDNFLTTQFPRALTGQLVHDCGVYAMRIAYLLSLVREEPTLKLEFRFVQLPVHIGLIITSSTAPLGAYLLHNDAVTRYEKTEIDAMRKTWDVTDKQGKSRPAAKRNPKTDDEFYGELAADAFVPLTDAPYVVTAVPHLKGTPAADKASMWATYQDALKHKLFGKVTEDATSPHYQFHLRYLALLELIKKHYNLFLVPFWNEFGHEAWKASRDALTTADAKRNAAKTPAERAAADAAFAAARDAYLNGPVGKSPLSVEAAFTKVETAYQEVVKVSQALTTDIQAHPEIVAKGASQASTDRMLEVFDPFIDPPWSRVVHRHFLDISGGLLNAPPYAERKSLLAPID